MTRVNGLAEFFSGASAVTFKKTGKTQTIINSAGSSAVSSDAVQKVTSAPSPHNQKEQESLEEFLQRYRKSFFINKKV